MTGKPTRIEGMKVDRTFKKLHLLQSTGYNPEPHGIAKYVINYDDKTTAEIEIVYGKDVVDWWAYPDQAGPSETARPPGKGKMKHPKDSKRRSNST